MFPWYLSIGMTPAEYWDGDSELTIAYRRSYEYKRDRTNANYWLLGQYFYEALVDVSPVLRAFSAKNAKPLPYPERPYPITQKQIEEQEEEKARREYQKGLERMKALASNSKKKGVNTGGIN